MTELDIKVAPAEHRTVARVMAILELVVNSGEIGVKLSDLAVTLAAPKSSLHALAKGLVTTGYLREANGGYVVGPAISGLISTDALTTQLAYRHVLEKLATRWNETTMLSSLVGDTVVYLDSFEPDALIRASPKLNERLVLWPRSSGKVFLAYMDPKKLAGYLRRHHPDPDDAQIVRAEIEKTREANVGINVGQSGTDHIGLAVPVLLGHGPVNMAISMAGPRARMEDHLDEIIADMLVAARSLTI